MSNQQILLKALSQANYQKYSRVVAKLLGSVQAAIILGELIDRFHYHTDNSDHNPLIYKGLNWWYETIDKIEERTCIKRKGQDTAIKILEESGLIIKIQKGCPPKRYFYLHYENIIKLYSGTLPNTGKLNIELLICPKGTNQDGSIQDVQKLQIELSERNNLESPQVALEENDDLHIKNLSNEPKKQQTGLQPAVAVVAVFSCLDNVKLEPYQKQLLSKNYLEHRVKLAVEYMTHPSMVIKKELIAALRWHCDQPVPPNIKKTKTATATEIHQENKEYLKTIQDYQFIGLYKIQTSLNEICFCRCEKTTLHAIYNTDERIFSVDSLTFKEDVKKHLEKIHSEKHIVREKR